MWRLKDDSSVPPLPVVLGGAAASASPPLRPGCWEIRFDPRFADDYEVGLGEYSFLSGWTLYYHGTLRVEAPDQGGLRISGDLYAKRQAWDDEDGGTTLPDLPRRSKIPIRPRSDYAYYLTVSEIELRDDGLFLRLATYRLSSEEDDRCSDEESLSVHLAVPLERPPAWRKAPAGLYLRGPVSNSTGTVIGELELGWITGRSLRRAVVEVTPVDGLRFHTDNGSGKTLQDVFAEIGWKVDLAILESQQNSVGEVWKNRDLHAEMLRWRERKNLDRDWIYHVLVVPRIQEREEYGFGRMYDRLAFDSNLVPREGLVVAARSRFPDDERFGASAGKYLEDVGPAFFHALLHELGHAMGLSHRFRDAYFMQALVYIARMAEEGEFPDNLRWGFDPQDALRLRHYPDVYVRPGGLPYEQGYSYFPVPESDAITDVGDQFELAVVPCHALLPLGAPLKVHLRLTNRSRRPLPAPRGIGFSEGNLVTRVLGPGLQVQTLAAVSPLVGPPWVSLPAGGSLYHAETLVRGPRGALLPSPGRYTLEVEALWRGPAGLARVIGRTDFLVGPPGDPHNATVALAILGSRELAIPLIFRTSPRALTGDARQQIDAAVEVLKLAMACERLRPYYAASEARRLGSLGEIETAAGTVESTSVLTATEIESLTRLVEEVAPEARSAPAVRRMISIFHVRAGELVAGNLAPLELIERIERVLAG